VVVDDARGRERQEPENRGEANGNSPRWIAGIEL
jgi:hypothetical protein